MRVSGRMNRSRRALVVTVTLLATVATVGRAQLSEEGRSMSKTEQAPLVLRQVGPGGDWLRLMMPDQTPTPAGLGEPPPGVQTLRVLSEVMDVPLNPGWRETPLQIRPVVPVHWGFNRLVISREGYIRLGTGGRNPHTDEPYLFSVGGDGPVGDIGFTGVGPRRIFRNWALRAMNQMNLWSGPGASALIQMMSDQAGEVDSGRLNLFARGGGSGLRANSIRFLTRSGPNTVTERLVVAADGRVGIGTAAPRQRLDVRGDVTIGRPGAPGRLQMFDPASIAPWTVSVRDGKLVVERLVTKAEGRPRSGPAGSFGGGRALLVPLLLLGGALTLGALVYWHGQATLTPIVASVMLSSMIFGWSRDVIGDTAEADAATPRELKTETVGDAWAELQTPDGQAFRLLYYRGVESRDIYRTPDLPAQTSLVIAPANPKPGGQHLLLTDSTFLYVGFENELFRGGFPHGWQFAAPFAFGFNGDILVGDIGLVGNSPHQIGSRDFSRGMSQTAPTAYFSNRNFPGVDEHSGAGFAMWSGEQGNVDSGRIDVIAYGRGESPTANSIRFKSRSGPDEVADRMIVTGDGRVGIGTVEPRTTLDVIGDVQVGNYEMTSGIVLYDTVDGQPYRIAVAGQWTANTTSRLTVTPTGAPEGGDEPSLERVGPLLPPPDGDDVAPSDLSARLATASAGKADLSIRVDRPGDDWIRLVAEDGATYRLQYQKSVESRPEYRSEGLDAVPALAIVPPDTGAATRVPMISENGRLYLGFENEIVSPHSGVPYAFAADGSILVGDIMLLGFGPRRIGFRHVPLTKSTPTYLHSNLNFADTDEDGGAGIALWSDEPGAPESGQVELIAYGQGSGPRANSIRLFTGANVERMCIDGRGRVGIGTRSPTHALEVHGDMNIGTSEAPGGIILYDETDGSAWRLQVTSGNVEIVRVGA